MQKVGSFSVILSLDGQYSMLELLLNSLRWYWMPLWMMFSLKLRRCVCMSSLSIFMGSSISLLSLNSLTRWQFSRRKLWMMSPFSLLKYSQMTQESGRNGLDPRVFTIDILPLNISLSRNKNSNVLCLKAPHSLIIADCPLASTPVMTVIQYCSNGKCSIYLSKQSAVSLFSLQSAKQKCTPQYRGSFALFFQFIVRIRSLTASTSWISAGGSKTVFWLGLSINDNSSIAL